MLPLSVLSKLQSALEEIDAAKSALSDELTRINQAIAEYDANAIKLRALIVEFSGRGIEQVPDIQSSMVATQEPEAVVSSSPPEPKSTRNAMLELFRETNRPMHYRTEITPALLKQGLLANVKSPQGTVNAHLGHDKRFRQTTDKPGYWQLASWSERRFPNRAIAIHSQDNITGMIPLQGTYEEGKFTLPSLGLEDEEDKAI